MAGPQFSGQLGGPSLGASQFGQFSLGGVGPWTVPQAPPLLYKNNALPFIAHLYSNTLQFKKSLGPALARPKLKWSLNSGHHPVQLDYPSLGSTAKDPSVGDIIRLTEQGGDGKVIYTGFVADIVPNIDAKPPYVSLMVDALVTELGDSPFDHNYTSAVDIAQMVRDAVANTTHLMTTPQSCPDSGVYAIFNFRLTNCLDVVNTCKNIGGPDFWFYVDELGIVWFQRAVQKGRPVYTITQGANYSTRKKSSPLSTIKNYVIVGGGLPNFAGDIDNIPVLGVYRNQDSINRFGVRFFTPILFYPAAVDQGAINNIAFTIGSVLSYPRVKVQVTLPNYGSRFQLGRFGGPTIRYWEPAAQPMTAPSDAQHTGQYSPIYVVLDVEMDGPSQTLILGDLPVTADDFKHQIDGVVARSTTHLILYPPVTINHYTLFPTLGAGAGNV